MNRRLLIWIAMIVLLVALLISFMGAFNSSDSGIVDDTKGVSTFQISGPQFNQRFVVGSTVDKTHAWAVSFARDQDLVESRLDDLKYLGFRFIKIKSADRDQVLLVPTSPSVRTQWLVVCDGTHFNTPKWPCIIEGKYKNHFFTVYIFTGDLSDAKSIVSAIADKLDKG